MKYRPYTNYKDSGVEWLNETPDHWNILKSKFIFSQSNIKALSVDEQLTASQKYGVIPQSLFMEKENLRVVLALKGTEGFKHIDKNDFVISLRSFQGGIELCHYSGCVSPAYTVLKSKTLIDYGYWSYLFKENLYIQSLNTAIVGIRDGKNISYSNFGNISVPVPSIEEQNSIAKFLDNETSKIDNLISKQGQLIQLLEEQRKSIISHAVTKGLNHDAPMKDSGVEWLNEIPEHWELKPIKFIAKTNQYSLSEQTDPNLVIEYIDIGSVSYTNGVEKTENILFSEAPSRARKIVHCGDIIVSTVRTYLKAIAYIDESLDGMIASTGFAVITSNEKIINPHFAKYAFLSQSFIDEVIAKSKGISYPAINSTELINIKIPIPSLSEQNEIITFLSDESFKIDKLIVKEKLLIKKLQEYRSSIISHAVTGKIDVREAL